MCVSPSNQILDERLVGSHRLEIGINIHRVGHDIKTLCDTGKSEPLKRKPYLVRLGEFSFHVVYCCALPEQSG